MQHWLPIATSVYVCALPICKCDLQIKSKVYHDGAPTSLLVRLGMLEESPPAPASPPRHGWVLARHIKSSAGLIHTVSSQFSELVWQLIIYQPPRNSCTVCTVILCTLSVDTCSATYITPGNHDRRLTCAVPTAGATYHCCAVLYQMEPAASSLCIPS